MKISIQADNKTIFHYDYNGTLEHRTGNRWTLHSWRKPNWKIPCAPSSEFGVRPVLGRRLGQMTSRGPSRLRSFPVSMMRTRISLWSAAHEFSIASLSMGRLQPLSCWLTQQSCQAKSCSITLWEALLAEADHMCVLPHYSKLTEVITIKQTHCFKSSWQNKVWGPYSTPFAFENPH